MADPVSDSTLTNADARLTSDKGLGYESYPAEKIELVFNSHGKVTGIKCDRFTELGTDVLNLNQPQTRTEYKNELERQFQVLYIRLIGIPYTSTTCLLKAAGSFHQLLLLFHDLENEKRIPIVAGILLDIYSELVKRTQRPYQYKIVFDDKDMFKPLPTQMLNVYPLNQYELWKQYRLIKKVKATKEIKSPAMDGLIPIIEKEQPPVDQKKIDTAIETATANLKITAELASIPRGNTPQIDLYRANLFRLSLEDIYKQTGFRNRAGDWKLSDLVDIIFYASSMTLVLDKHGEPLGREGLYGLFSYGMILPNPKFQTMKFVPPPGQYISLGPFAGQQFKFQGGIIEKLGIQYSGILSYQEIAVTGQWTPDYQEKANEIFGKYRMYIGSLVVKSAFGSKDIGITDMVTALPEIVAATIPYIFEVVKRKIKVWYDNYDDILKEMAKEVLKNLIVETLKDVAVRYIVKKIGKRVIPGINVVAGIKDAIDSAREKDSVRDTVAINCVRLYLKAINKDDETLAVKILANIMGDEFESDVKGAIINHASKQGIKLVKKVKGKDDLPVAKPKPVGHSQPIQEPAAAALKPNATGPVRGPKADARTIEAGWRAFHLSQKEQETQKEMNRAAAQKANNRTEEKKAASAKAPAATGQEDEKKKALAARLALIKERQNALEKKKSEEKIREEARKTGDKKTQNKKSGAKITTSQKVADETAVKGKKTRMNEARRKARQAAIKDAWESLKAGNPTPQALHLAERLESQYGREKLAEFMETGKLPKGVEFSHLFSASEYPEFAHRGDLGVLTDEEEHRQGHHGGDTREPLHGSPRIPGEDNGDDDE